MSEYLWNKYLSRRFELSITIESRTERGPTRKKKSIFLITFRLDRIIVIRIIFKHDELISLFHVIVTSINIFDYFVSFGLYRILYDRIILLFVHSFLSNESIEQKSEGKSKNETKLIS